MFESGRCLKKWYRSVSLFFWKFLEKINQRHVRIQTMPQEEIQKCVSFFLILDESLLFLYLVNRIFYKFLLTRIQTFK